jgi:hypothetical protein
MPLTDGINVAFVRDFANDGVTIVLRTQAGVEEVLATGVGPVFHGTRYQVVGGRIAFLRGDGTHRPEPARARRQ